MLTNWQTDLILDAEAQTSDKTTRTIDLPRDGHISMLDLVVAATNGSTSNLGYSSGTAGQSIFDAITKLEIIANGSKTVLSVTNIEDLIAESIRLTGTIPARTITEKLGEVQRIHIPIYFGRFVDDKLMVIPNGPYNNGNFFDSLQMKITYDMTVSATTAFTTGSLTLSVVVKKLIDNSPPETKLIKTFQHKEDYTTVGSGTKSINLTYGPALFMRSIQVKCYEAGIGEGVDITKLRVDYNSLGGGKLTPFENEWKSVQYHNAESYGIGPLSFVIKAFTADTHTLATRVPDISSASFAQQATLADGDNDHYNGASIAGDTITMSAFDSTATTEVKLDVDKNIFATITSDVIPRYAYIDFDESKTMNDLLDTGGMSALVLKMTDGAAGAAVVINEEFVMRSIDFRSA